jgi:hypothetical protein
MRVSLRVRAAGGMAGAVAFTAAWVAGSLRQRGHSFAGVQISGLAALDARDPWIMIGGFVALGMCLVPFGSALREALSRTGPAGPGPAVIQVAGAATIAAGLLRRDRMQVSPRGPLSGESWHNHGHDLASVVIYTAMVVAPLLLAPRFRGHPQLAGLRAPMLASSVGSAAVLALFFGQMLQPSAGLLQRVAMTLPLSSTFLVALRLVTTTAPRSTPGGNGPGGNGPQPIR